MIQIIESYLLAFDSFTISDQQLKNEIEDWRQRALQFASNISDPVEFSTKFAECGLQSEYMGLVTRATMAAYPSTDAQEPAAAEATLPTVREFVEQYRTAYQGVTTSPFRTGAIKAYEALFAVAERTDDLMDAQIIIEKERLLWNIVKDDALDTFTALCDATDPLYTQVWYPVQSQVEIYEKSRCDEELEYLNECATQSKMEVVENARQLITICSQVAALLTGYCTCKRNIYARYGNLDGNVLGMVFIKAAINDAINTIHEQFGRTIHSLLDDKHYKIWFLGATPGDAIGRCKISLNPQNLSVFKDIIDNEIVPDMSPRDALMRSVQHSYYADFADAQKDEYAAQATEFIDAQNSEFTYFKNTAYFQSNPLCV